MKYFFLLILLDGLLEGLAEDPEADRDPELVPAGGATQRRQQRRLIVLFLWRISGLGYVL